MTKPIIALALLLGLLSAAPAATAATAFELGTGSRPDVDVDAGGTAHIVVDLPDERLRYCQVPRGQTTCAVDRTLTPRAQATGRSSFVFVTAPNRVVIVTERCCPPDGVFAYQSTDNGATFSGPTQIGDVEIEDAVFGPGDAISALENSGWYQRMPLSGPGATDEARLNPGFTVPTGSSVALLDGTRPFKVSADGDNTTWSVFSGAGDPNSDASWTGPNPVTPAGSEPHLASGSAGLVLLDRVGGELRARKFDGGFGSGISLSDGDPIQADLTTDDSGRFTAVWIENQANEFRAAASSDGQTWGPSATVLSDLPSDGLFHTQVATAPDGEGFAVFDSNSEGGKIVVTPLDPRAAVGDGTSTSPPPLATTTVNGTEISFFGPTTCVQRPKNIVLRVTSKRKRQLSPRRRVKITRVVFSVDRKKKTDRRKAFRKSFPTRRFQRGSRHRVGAVVRLAPVKKGAFRAKTKRLKGRFRMCRT